MHYLMKQREAELRGIEEGREEGRKEGREEGRKRMAFNLHALGMSNDDIATAAEVSVDTVSKWLSELQTVPAV